MGSLFQEEGSLPQSSIVRVFFVFLPLLVCAGMCISSSSKSLAVVARSRFLPDFFGGPAEMLGSLIVLASGAGVTDSSSAISRDWAR